MGPEDNRNAQKQRCPICRTLIERLNICYSHKKEIDTAPEVSPIIVKDRGFQTLENVNLLTLKLWKNNTELALTQKQSAMENLQQQIFEIQMEAKEQKLLLAALDREIDKKEHSRQIQNETRMAPRERSRSPARPGTSGLNDSNGGVISALQIQREAQIRRQNGKY